MHPTTPAEFLQAYTDTVYAKDAAAFLALYTPDARLYDTWGAWVYEDTAARRAPIEGWFASLGDERVQVRFDAVQTTTDQTLAVLTATGRYAAIAPDGRELRSMQNRFTWVLSCAQGRWAIAHEHTSTPIGFEDLKGILSRDAG